MSKIPLDHIRAFATKDETRYVLTAPRIVGEMIAATDGRVLVEVATSEVAIDELEVVEGNYPKYKDILEPEFEAPLVPFDMSEIPAKPEAKTCRECHGQGFYECNCPDCDEWHDCEACDGDGSYFDPAEWCIDAGGSLTQAAFVEKALVLPNLKWFQPAEGSPLKPVRFTFGETGRGLIMQLRREEA